MSDHREHKLLAFKALCFPNELRERCEEISPNSEVRGFRFGGIHAGIKRGERLDFGLIFCDHGASCAGVFTQNQVVAAPVTLSRQHLKESSLVYAVVANSGNANACTGEEGYRAAAQMCDEVAQALSSLGTSFSAEQVQVASTGVIGAPLPISLLSKALPELISALETDQLKTFATAIMTTDNRPKSRAIKLNLEGVVGAGRTREVTLSACSKGAGMIHPHMATMLAYMVTDAQIDSVDLQSLWAEVCDHSFNAITIDGDTSTNDTALILASGQAITENLDHSTQAPLKGEALRLFTESAKILATALAVDILRDGEGVEHVAELIVNGARNRAEARQVAETVALSPLVKTAMNGQDPNWGRIIAAVGRSGVKIDPHRITLSIGGATIYDRGRWCGLEAEALAHEAMVGAEYPIELDLDLGQGSFTLYTTDLSAQYVKINADYRS